MGIKFTAQFNTDQAVQKALQKIQRIDQFILNALKYTGLEFVRNARTNANFTDQTGNLRSSIGYLLLKDGKPIDEDFTASPIGTDRETGKKKGYEFALSKFKQEKGYVLILVAGMQYAAAVESKGFDVITTSSFLAKDSVQKLFEDLKKQTGNG